MKIKIRYVLAVIFAFIIGWVIYGNSYIEISHYNIESEKIPDSFNGFCIMQISDLHNAEFGTDNKKLISKIKDTKADMIAITGDMIDWEKTDVDVAINFAKNIAEIAPTYYVNGNHEAGVPDEYDKLKNGLLDAGVIILENSSVDIVKGEEKITIIGINDPSFMVNSAGDTNGDKIKNQLDDIVYENENYKILLAHRPEYFDTYSGKVDLVLSGHAHGGQFIIPFVGGLVAPGQGLFPQYYSGVYKNGDTDMIVSRGVGNSIIPVRINNNPEIVMVKLIKK